MLPRKSWLFALTGLLGIGWRLPASFGQPSVKLAVGAERVGRYEKVEFLIHLNTTYHNPFDPDEVDLSLELRTPTGRTLSLPAFYYQPYERRVLESGGRKADWLYPVGAPVWQARFAPMEVGQHVGMARLRDRRGMTSSNTVTFTCVPSERRGFVRVSAKDSRFFAFDNGAPFFPIGQDLAFIGSMQYVTLSKAEDVFRRMSENGANYVRIWTCCDDWAMAIESRKSAWGRSWAWKPPIVPAPGDEGKKCLQLTGADGAALTVEPSHPVALRPNTRYVVSGRLRTEGGAGVSLEVQGARVGDLIAADPKKWMNFQREFTTDANGWWLNAMRLRLNGNGTVWLSDLSLRECPNEVWDGGGAELLWEADVNRPVMGVYNPTDCFMLDQIVAAAEKHGVYLQLCLLTRNLYMDSLRDEKNADYDKAIAAAKKLLRYAVARWGYSTSVASWEYWNEQNPNLPTDRFYAECGHYLEQIDPYRHLRATSAWGPAPKDWRHEKLDVADLHWYLRPNWNELWKDAAAAAQDRAKSLRQYAPRRPALLSEFGLADEKWGLSPYMKQDKDLLHFHDALWASALSGVSGTAMFWWWEQLDQMDAYRHYKPLAAFVADIPFTTTPLRDVAARVSDDRVRVMGLQGKDCAYFYLSDAEAMWYRMVVEKATPTEVKDVFVEIEGLSPGDYQAQWWDTNAGKVIRQEPVSAQSQRLRLSAPPFVRDVACKVLRRSQSR